MYKLVIIDDEPPILQGLRTVIDWNAYGFSHIRTFSNPVQAYESIVADVPDVILCDIRMPVMNGLTLLEKCRSQQISALFVLISAYSEFEYAQQAMENGAFSYVIKPLRRDTMRDLAQKLRAKLQSTRQAQMHFRVRTSVLQALTGGSEPEEGFLADWIRIDGPYRVCFAAAKPGEDGFWFSIYDDLTVGFVPLGQEPDMRGKFVGLSHVAEGAVLHKSIREALMAYYTLRFCGGEPRALCYEQKKMELKWLDEISQMAARGDAQGICARLEQMNIYVRQQTVPIDQLMYLYNRLISILMAQAGDRDFEENIHFFGSCFSMCGIFSNVDTMFDSLKAITEDLCSGQPALLQESKAAVRAAIAYVDKNYTGLITLELLAKQFHISLSYLSRQFKQMTGTNFSGYLKNKRITYACELLRTSGMSVSDIGTACGYEDYFYFNKTFKNATGLTPTKYREAHRAQ